MNRRRLNCCALIRRSKPRSANAWPPCAPAATTPVPPNCARTWRRPRAARDNLLPPIIDCVEGDVTLGEICHTLRGVFGEYRPSVHI